MEYLSSEETVHNEDVDHFLSPGKVYEKSRSIEGESNDLQVQPLSWIPSILILVLFSVLYFLAYHRIIPSYIERTGQPYLIAYLWVWVVSMGVVLLTSLILYYSEAHRFNWNVFSARYRLRRMTGMDCFWSLVVLIVCLGLYLGTSSISRWLASVPIFAPAPLAPAELRPDPAGNTTPGLFFSMTIQGQWWVVAVYFIGWVFNILGEELFYRGWMLPRQQLAFRRYAWLVNGTMFTFQHWMQPFNFLGIWPGALFMAWVVQQRRNTWIGILQHGLMNFVAIVVLIRGVVGW